MKTGKLLLLGIALSLSGCGLELGYPTGQNATDTKESSTKLRIFVTDRATTGLMGNSGAGRIDAADDFCMDDANRPSGSATYRALLVDGSDRIATPGNQRDWVLRAKTTYIRPDRTVIGTTNADAVFTFPLTAAISTQTLPVWTGLDADWRANADDCNAWRDDGASRSGRTGRPSFQSNEAISNAAGSSLCSQSYRLYCVEQPSR